MYTYTQRYITVTWCSTSPLSNILTDVLAVVKTGQQKYHDAKFSRSGVNQIWILKYSKDWLKTLFS